MYSLTTETIFDLDLLGKNLQMNGIEVTLQNSDQVDSTDTKPTLFVRLDQKDQAIAILKSLDLMDFISSNGK